VKYCKIWKIYIYFPKGILIGNILIGKIPIRISGKIPIGIFPIGNIPIGIPIGKIPIGILSEILTGIFPIGNFRKGTLCVKKSRCCSEGISSFS
jgi:hypothetical protein